MYNVKPLTVLSYVNSSAIELIGIPILIPLNEGFVSNFCALWDIVFGALATLIGAVGTHYIAKIDKRLAPIPPILANAAIVPFVLKYTYGFAGSIWYFAVTVGIGEIISCGVLGLFLLRTLDKHGNRIFRNK